MCGTAHCRSRPLRRPMEFEHTHSHADTCQVELNDALGGARNFSFRTFALANVDLKLSNRETIAEIMSANQKSPRQSAPKKWTFYSRSE